MKQIAMTLFLLLALAAGAPTQGPPPVTNGCPTADDWGAPGGVQVTPVPDGLRISWIPSPRTPSDVEGFQVVRSLDVNGPWEPLALVLDSVNEIIDPAPPETVWFYRVRSFGGGICGPYSTPAQGIPR